ncbi:hypothetical protein MMC28_000713 [Mycoblastus sanguinarius]|nr:hypothetical protein [Mycoblastus sanguinarius]
MSAFASKLANSSTRSSNPEEKIQAYRIRTASHIPLWTAPSWSNKYYDVLDKIRKNDSPRQRKPMPQWIREWEDKSEGIIREGKLTPKPKL